MFHITDIHNSGFLIQRGHKKRESSHQAHTDAPSNKTYFRDGHTPTLYLGSRQGKMLLVRGVFLLLVWRGLCWRRWPFPLQIEKKSFIVSFFKYLTFSFTLSLALGNENDFGQALSARPKSRSRICTERLCTQTHFSSHALCFLMFILEITNTSLVVRNNSTKNTGLPCRNTSVTRLRRETRGKLALPPVKGGDSRSQNSTCQGALTNQSLGSHD